MRSPGRLHQWHVGFYGAVAVINGASDFFVEILGDAGRHTRIAVGVNALPYDVAVEVEAMFEVGS